MTKRRVRKPLPTKTRIYHYLWRKYNMVSLLTEEHKRIDTVIIPSSTHQTALSLKHERNNLICWFRRTEKKNWIESRRNGQMRFFTPKFKPRHYVGDILFRAIIECTPVFNSITPKKFHFNTYTITVSWFSIFRLSFDCRWPNVNKKSPVRCVWALTSTSRAK